MPSIHFRTVDHRPGEVLLKLISAKTGTPLARVAAASVSRHANVGICRNDRSRDVIAFCPACLKGGAYFRRRWRLDFVLVCEVHKTLLYDGCPACRGLVRLERIPLAAESLATCHCCGFDLTTAEPKPLSSPRLGNLLALERRLASVLGLAALPDLQGEKPAGAVVRAGMQITPGGGDARVSESGLHQVNGRAAVESVRSMRVTEPLRRDGNFDAGAMGGFADDAQDGDRAEPASAFPLAGAEDRIIRSGLRGSQRGDQFPDRSRHLNRAGDPALAKHGNLAAVSIGLQVPPGEPTQFAGCQLTELLRQAGTEDQQLSDDF